MKEHVKGNFDLSADISGMTSSDATDLTVRNVDGLLKHNSDIPLKGVEVM